MQEPWAGLQDSNDLDLTLITKIISNNFSKLNNNIKLVWFMFIWFFFNNNNIFFLNLIIIINSPDPSSYSF
jgi:hypothetical protein